MSTGLSYIETAIDQAYCDKTSITTAKGEIMKVEKPSDILDLLRAHYGATSDYQVGKMLCFEKSRVSVWRTNRSWPDDDLLLDFEKLLKLPTGSLYFSMLADRTKCPRAVSILHKTAEKAAAGLLCFMLVFPVFIESIASPAGHFFRTAQCILCKIKRVIICPPKRPRLFTLSLLFNLFFTNTAYCWQIAKIQMMTTR